MTLKRSLIPVLIVIVLAGVLLTSAFAPISTQSARTTRPETVRATFTPFATITPAPAATLPPGREPMTYPAGYRETLTHYLTVDRGDGVTRNIYISPAAIDAVRRGDRIPDGTITVIEAFDAQRAVNGGYALDSRGRLIAESLRVDEIHVGERRSTWLIEDTHANTNFEGWNFRAFNFETGAPIDRELNECFNCHDRAFRTEFVFTRDELEDFARTGTIQYFYCAAPARIPCQ
ncbi:MAG: cytochrome P460 family protein [bacterium]|nr:cytochrome P460 family protein [bacterium]